MTFYSSISGDKSAADRTERRPAEVGTLSGNTGVETEIVGIDLKSRMLLTSVRPINLEE